MSPEVGLRWLLVWLFRREAGSTADRTAKTVNNARRAAVRRCDQREPSNAVDAHIRVILPVGGVANAPVTAAVQPVIKHERRGQGWQVGHASGIVSGARLEIEQLATGHAAWRGAMI